MGKGTNTMHKLMIAAAAALAFAASPASAQDMSKFHDGPVFTGFGKIADVDSDMPIPPGTVLKIDLDVSKGADPGKVNGGIDSAARFINMNVAAGVPETDIRVAVVIHGPAVWDVTTNAAYGKKYDGKTNANAAMIAQLVAHGVQFYVCGQAATAMGVNKTDLLPGVKMAVSAMTAHALLQEEGYAIIP